MPGWSPEIANEFIRLGAAEKRAFDQLQLQGLVYIAHGWCLASHAQPLTGDRPEAWEFGPAYRKLSDALARYGREPVTNEIMHYEGSKGVALNDADESARSDLDQLERELIREIYQEYGSFESWQLSEVTRKKDAPWKEIFANGAGKFRDIPHNLIRAQFVELLRQSGKSPGRK